MSRPVYHSEWTIIARGLRKEPKVVMVLLLGLLALGAVLLALGAGLLAGAVFGAAQLWPVDRARSLETLSDGKPLAGKVN